MARAHVLVSLLTGEDAGASRVSPQPRGCRTACDPAAKRWRRGSAGSDVRAWEAPRRWSAGFASGPSAATGTGQNAAAAAREPSPGSEGVVAFPR